MYLRLTIRCSNEVYSIIAYKLMNLPINMVMYQYVYRCLKNVGINTVDFSATIGEHWLISKTYTKNFPN